MHKAHEYYECTRGKEFQIPSLGLCDLIDKSAQQTTLYEYLEREQYALLWKLSSCIIIE